MTDITNSLHKLTNTTLPFPASWIRDHPSEVEEVIAKLSIEDQIRCAMQLHGSQMQDFINLSPDAQAVIRGLPPEELYQMIKESGIGESLPVLAMMSPNQLQYSFDLEWWQRDRFVPECALEWLELLDKCENSSILGWLQGEDFDQKVVLFQSLIKVYKDDEMTNSYEGVEGMPHLTIDGVYDIYFKTDEYGALKRLFTVLHYEDEALYRSFLEAVIWYPLTETVEKAYRWRLTRTSERGIPSFEEAMGIYSHLDPEALNLPLPVLEDFSYPGEFNIAPTYPLSLTESVLFLKDVILQLDNPYRLNTICWELVYLANKTIVADQMEPSNLEAREESLKKVLGYVNIGLELGASNDLIKGAKLLGRSQIQSLFQVGYQQLMNLRWKAEKFLKENGSFLEWIFAEFNKNQLAALLDRFPRVAKVDGDKETLNWRHFSSVKDVHDAQLFLERWTFNIRFTRKCLGLNAQLIKEYLEIGGASKNNEDIDLYVWTLMALAHYVLFQKISCQPLSKSAAKSFLEIIFLPEIFKEEMRSCDNTLVEAFHRELLKLPLAWIEQDRTFLAALLDGCILRLREEFGRFDPKSEIDWRFTRGLVIALENT